MNTIPHILDNIIQSMENEVYIDIELESAPEQPTSEGYRVVWASPVEIGLTHNGYGVRTWWAFTFNNELPPLDHPLIREAISTQTTREHIDELLQSTAYEIIRREGLHHNLTSEQWDAAAVELAGELRVVVDGFIKERS